MKALGGFKSLRFWWAALVFLLLSSCSTSSPLASRNADLALAGGIGGTGISGIGGTGITAYGIVQGFGSIFVNGREYFLDERTEVLLNGMPARESELHIGDVVAVEARLDVRSGHARTLRVHSDYQLQGLVERVDRENGTLELLGQTIQAGKLLASQDRRYQTLRLEDIRAGDLIAMHGFARGNGAWTATRLTRLDTPATKAAAPFILRGTVRSIDTQKAVLQVGQQEIAVTRPQQLKDFWIGQQVVVRGRYAPGVLQALSVQPEHILIGKAGDKVEMQGYLYQQPGSRQLVSNGIPVGAVDAAQDKTGSFVIMQGTLAPDRSLVIRRIELSNSPLDTPAFPLTPVRRPVLPVQDHSGIQRPEIQRPDIQRPQIQRPEIQRPEIPRP